MATTCDITYLRWEFCSLGCLWDALSSSAVWEPIGHPRGGTGQVKALNQTNLIIDSVSIYITCICIYLSNAYYNLYTCVRRYTWTEGHISVPLTTESVKRLTGPLKLDWLPPHLLQSTHTWQWNGRNKEIITHPGWELSAEGTSVLSAVTCLS